jgi:nucleoside-diphosphate-sugar epimerase
VHALTALPKNGPMRHRDMYQTDALRDVGTTHLLAAAREVGARKIVVESMHVGYGFGNWGDSILTEEQPFAPPGRSRELERHLAGLRSMEQQIFEAKRVGWIEGVSLRYGSFYGPESTLRVSNARARSELDWVPSVPTYREGIQRIVQALDVVTPGKADRVEVRAE